MKKYIIDTQFIGRFDKEDRRTAQFQFFLFMSQSYSIQKLYNLHLHLQNKVEYVTKVQSTTTRTKLTTKSLSLLRTTEGEHTD